MHGVAPQLYKDTDHGLRPWQDQGTTLLGFVLPALRRFLIGSGLGETSCGVQRVWAQPFGIVPTITSGRHPWHFPGQCEQQGMPQVTHWACPWGPAVSGQQILMPRS